jgi:hypothetical protein
MNPAVGTGIPTKWRRQLVYQGYGLMSGTTPGIRTILGQYTTVAYTVGDDSKICIQVPDAFLTAATALMISVRWCVNDNFAPNSPRVRWQYDWEAIPADGTEAVGAATHTVNIPTTAYQVKETVICTIPAASVSYLDTIGFCITRVALGAGNNPANEPQIMCLKVRMPELFPYPELVL